MWNPVDAVSWLWAVYAATLNVTLFLACLTCLAWLSRRCDPNLRASVWSAGVVGVLVVTVMCVPWYGAGRNALPVAWSASVLPSAVAYPMVALASAGIAERAVTAAAALEAPAMFSRPSLAWALALVWIWAAGAALLLARLIHGLMRIARISAAAMPLTAASSVKGIAHARSLLGLQRRVEVRSHPGIAAPLTWGMARPIVLLPASAASWPEAHFRAVMLHELAHVRRNDWVIQLLGRVACALFWFHPLVWRTVRQLQVAREEACDDAVLSAHVRPSDYAECLLRVADLARLDGAFAHAGVAVGIARAPMLQQRLRTILTPHRVDTRGTQTRAAVTLVAAAALCFAFGAVRLSPHPDVFQRALRGEDWARRTYSLMRLAHDAGITPGTAAAFVADEPDPRVRLAAQLLIGRSH